MYMMRTIVTLQQYNDMPHNSLGNIMMLVGKKKRARHRSTNPSHGMVVAPPPLALLTLSTGVSTAQQT